MGWFDSFKETLQKGKGYLLTGVSLSGRVMYAAGQTYFSMKTVNGYLKIDNTAWGKATEVTAVLGSVVSNFIGKAPAAWRQFGPHSTSVETPTEEHPLGWGSWLFKKTIEGSGIFYGFTNSIAGYFGTHSLSLDLMGKGLASRVTAETTSIYVAGTSLLSYYSYDFKQIQKNAESMAQAINEGTFRFNKAMAYTLGVGLAIIPPYLGQAYFWAKPSIIAIPYAEQILRETGINILTGFACGTTLFTIIGWLPSVYNYFVENNPETDTENVEPDNAWSTALKTVAYVSGAIDSLGGCGLGPFYSVVFTFEKLFGTNPYSWIILYAAVCGLNTAAMNMLFSVIPGFKDAQDMLFKRNTENSTDEEAALPIDNAANYGTLPKDVYKEDRGALLFTPPRSNPIDIPQVQQTNNEVSISFS